MRKHVGVILGTDIKVYPSTGGKVTVAKEDADRVRELLNMNNADVHRANFFYRSTEYGQLDTGFITVDELEK